MIERSRFAMLALALLLAVPPERADAARQAKSGADAEKARMEYKANDMLNRGLDLIKQNQEERGVKLLRSIPETFPTSDVRFRAQLALGRHFSDKRSFDLALRQFQLAAESDDPEEEAEALYRCGISYYNLNRYDQAFVTLRKVISEHPWSVFANEAYYYIGLCHFKLRRWARSVEALQMVGTSVQPNVEKEILAEAGQRLFINVEDEDLIVLADDGSGFDVEIETAAKDRETIHMQPLGKSAIRYIGSIPTAPGAAVTNDGIVQCMGNEAATVSYVDRNTEDGERNKKRVATVRLVSTASAGFTDGAYREYTRGVFADQPCFVRVKDLDGNVSDRKDRLPVTLRTQYRVEEEIDPEKTGVRFDDEPEIRERSSLSIMLTETEPHSGIFVGSAPVSLQIEDSAETILDEGLVARRDDEIVLEYRDEVHRGGDYPRTVSFTAKILTGDIQDVKIEHRLVESLDLKARKNLIEARMYLKLGEIFKDVGLTRQANEKADEGLSRVETVIKSGLQAGLERSLIEQAFNVKWDLLMVQDRLREAIAVCNTLIRMFPDSTLVDAALMKVAKARMEEGTPEAQREAMHILSGILRLKESDRKAEAQYMIAGAAEKEALKRAESNGGRTPDLSRAMTEYKKCSDLYPESLFAGRALEKIASYYIKTQDYRRAAELMEQVFQDYPDASFLDTMLLKWAIAAYRLGDLTLAKEKTSQVLAEYPNSPEAKKAEKILEILNKKMGG